MTISFSTSTQNPFTSSAPISFAPVAAERPASKIGPMPSDWVTEQVRIRDEALLAGDTATYHRARRSIRSHYRYHALQNRDASKFPISHDDHLASVAHQFNYHGKGDVERMSVGLNPVSEWIPPLLRKMDAAAGTERVTYDVPGVGETHDWLSISQRDQQHPNPDRDELPSDYTLSSIAQAEMLGCHVDDLERGMRARSTNTYSPAE